MSRFAAVAASLLLLAATGPTAVAEPDAEPHEATPLAPAPRRDMRFEGTWELRRPRTAWRSRERAIQRATARLGLFVREPARRQLREKIPVHYRVVLGATPEGLHTRAGAYDLTLPLDGAAHPWVDPWGASYRVRQHVGPDGMLVQRFTASGRSLTQTLRVDGNEAALTVVATARRLPRPVRFTAGYQRR